MEMGAESGDIWWVELKWQDGAENIALREGGKRLEMNTEGK